MYITLTGVRKIASRKIAPRSGSGFGLGLALELGLGGNFPRGQFSYNHINHWNVFSLFIVLRIEIYVNVLLFFSLFFCIYWIHLNGIQLLSRVLASLSIPCTVFSCTVIIALFKIMVLSFWFFLFVFNKVAKAYVYTATILLESLVIKSI